MKLILIYLIRFSIQDCKNNCLKCDQSNENCLFCDVQKDQVVEVTKCIQLKFKNCLKHWTDDKCIQCEDNYYLDKGQCFEKTGDITIDNCESYISSNSCVKCKSTIDKHFYIQNGKCILVDNKIEGCVLYQIGNQEICQICGDEYMKNRLGKLCIKKETKENCHYYSFLECKSCKEKYILNKNYYLKQFFELKSTNQRTQLANWLFINELNKTNVCEFTDLENCKVKKHFNECGECISNYYLSEGKCFPYPLESIQNCKKYDSLQICSECEESFYLQKPNQCTKGSLKSCLLIDSTKNEIFCLICSKGFILSGANCLVRQTTIDNCKDYQSEKEACKICEEGFEPTSDNKVCLKTIQDCSKYLQSSETSQNHICEFCIDKKTFSTLKEKCEDGTVENCLKYQQNNVCIQCDGLRFIKDNICLDNSEVIKCKSQKSDTKGICQECEQGNLNITISNQCVKYKNIDNCLDYDSVNKCKNCKDGFYQLDLDQPNEFSNKCEVIPAINNCLQSIGESKCTKCKPFSVLTDKSTCSRLIDKYQENCQQVSSQGLILVDQSNKLSNFKCDYCKLFNFPMNLTDFYICTHKDNISQPITNCQKYKLKNSLYVCEKCKTGFYLDLLDSKICVTECSNNQFIALQLLSKQQDITDKYQVINSNICVENQTLDSCTIKNPDIFIQNKSSTINYSCVKCLSNSISIVKLQSSTNFNSEKFNIEIESPVSVYPGLYCITATADAVKSQNKVNNKVEFCDYYYNLIRNNTNNKYGCLKCQIGYTGIIQSDSQKQIQGYVDRCEPMNEIVGGDDNVEEGKCDLDVRYFGYTNYNYQIVWNKTPLESFISCFKCKNTSKIFKPFLFISFEDKVNYDDNYNLLTTNLFDFDTKTNYSPFSNKMTIFAVLQAYSLGSTPLSKNSGGRYLRCLDLQASNFGLQENQYNILGTTQADKEKCSIFIVNVNRTADASKSYEANPSISKSTIYCGSCIPGYRPTYSKKITTIEVQPSDIFIPFYVYHCQKIPNCQETNQGNWVNNCQNCETGFVWFYDKAKFQIDYSQCLATIVPNCAAIDEFNKCVICQKGYQQSNDRCDRIYPAFCKKEESIFDSSFQTDPDDVSLGRNLLYLNRNPVGCNQCDDDYVSLYEPAIADGETQHYFCVFSEYLENSQNNTNQIIQSGDVFFKSNCQFFSILNQAIICRICENNYYLDKNFSCLPASGIYLNFLKVYFENEIEIIICKQGFVLINRECKVGNIDQCFDYVVDQNLAIFKCKKCANGFYSTVNKCEKGNLNNCVEYENANTCKKCLDKYEVFNITGGTICIFILEEFNCKVINSQQLQLKALQCDECNSLYFIQQLNDSFSFCLPFTQLENCIKYNESDFKCNQCSVDFYLEGICKKRTIKDVNCTEFIQLQDLCKTCKEKYYLSSNKQNCVQNPSGILGCQNYTNQTTCALCKQGKYLVNNTCLDVPEQIPNCLYYQNSTKCSQCEGKYFQINGKCELTSAENCTVAISSTACQECPENHGIQIEKFIKHCRVKTDTNCLSYISELEFDCIECSIDYYLESGKCVKRDFSIENCISYAGKGQCQKCNSLFLLSIDQKECVQEISFEKLMDGNCKEFRLVSPSVCVSCVKGYFFGEEGKCEECKEQKVETGCDYCDPVDEKKCLLCSQGYFQDKSGKCNKLDEVVTNNTEEVVKVGFVDVIQRYMIGFVLFVN